MRGLARHCQQALCGSIVHLVSACHGASRSSMVTLHVCTAHAIPAGMAGVKKHTCARSNSNSSASLWSITKNLRCVHVCVTNSWRCCRRRCCRWSPHPFSVGGHNAAAGYFCPVFKGGRPLRLWALLCLLRPFVRQAPPQPVKGR